jgi:hypothetical protein
MYFPSPKMVKYHVDIIWLPKDLLYKDIPIDHVFQQWTNHGGEQVYITSNYKDVYVKYLLCTIEGIYFKCPPQDNTKSCTPYPWFFFQIFLV